MKTIPNEKRLSGSIVLERGTSFLARQIIYHMKILAVLTGRKPAEYSHAEFLIWNEYEKFVDLTDNKGRKKQFRLERKTLYTVGARSKGIEISEVSDYYTHNEIKVRVPKKLLTFEENWYLMQHFLLHDPAKYQYGNFAVWITDLKIQPWLLILKPEKRKKLLEKIWLGTRKDKRFYCYRFVADMIKSIDRWTGDDDRVSIYDLLEVGGYEDYEP